MHVRRIEGEMNHFPVDTAENVLVLAFDSIVFTLTIAKTWQLYRQWREISRNWRTSLAAVLLHDGMLAHSSYISL